MCKLYQTHKLGALFVSFFMGLHAKYQGQIFFLVGLPAAVFLVDYRRLRWPALSALQRARTLVRAANGVRRPWGFRLLVLGRSLCSVGKAAEGSGRCLVRPWRRDAWWCELLGLGTGEGHLGMNIRDRR